ncbi:MAG: hypothetical protein AVDCRST_MAG16-823, partial [uncultured Frankineae bacterium]
SPAHRAERRPGGAGHRLPAASVGVGDRSAQGRGERAGPAPPARPAL